MNAILIAHYPIQLKIQFFSKGENNIMIETKYGLKYSMPHSLVHIVDNSEYNGPIPVVMAEDPSLLASIVVTGAPMGADNKMITITRSDVLGVAYGMSNISVDNIKKYGQSITYAGSLINQGAPVRFMRVTPEGSTYAVSSMVVQWRIDGTDNKLHVRFKMKDWPEDLTREKFKNTSRVNEALIKSFKDDNADTDGNGTWKQRAFINFIAAGRGGEYNYMANAINSTSQAKRPANVRYEFSTIDTRTNQVVERFYASLMNINNGNRTDAIDSVNTTIAKRLEGSSITVPYVNDAAVREIYNEYMKHFKEMLENTDVDEFTSNAYKAMNINIFDMIFGNYIYNGTDSSTKMPFYQVDMIDTDIPELPEERRLCVINDSVTISDGKTESLWNSSNPEVLYNKLMGFTYGVTRSGDDVHVGDIYLTTSGNTMNNPKINIVTAINQYTGNVTSMTIPRVFPLTSEALSENEAYNGKACEAWKGLYHYNPKANPKRTSRVISILVDDIQEGAATDNAVSKTINSLVNKGTITDGSVIASTRWVYDSETKTYKQLQGFDLYTVEVKETIDSSTNQKKTDTILHYMDKKYYYEMLDRDSHSGGYNGTGNAMGFWYTKNADAAWNRFGATVVIQNTSSDEVTNEIYVNDYQRSAADDAEGVPVTTHRIHVSEAAVEGKIGTVPSSVNLAEDVTGSQYDIKVYKNDSIDKWKITGLGIKETGASYSVGDRLYVNVRGQLVDVDKDGYTIKEAEDIAKEAWQNDNPKGGSESDEEYKARFEAWYALNKSMYSDVVDTNSCGTIITVSKVDNDGKILSFNITKNIDYDAKSEDGVSVLDILANQKKANDPKYLVAKYIPTSKADETAASGKKANISLTLDDFKVTQENSSPEEIDRYTITGSMGSLYRVQLNPSVIPANYYSNTYGINPTSEVGGMRMTGGSTGFFDDENINEIEFKWRYSALLVKAFRGEIDSRIQSPTRCPAKFMFDAGYNTIVGSTILPYLTYTPTDIINASIIFTEDEKEELLFNPDIISNIANYEDIDVKQAMYDLMIYRCYQGIPEDKRPIGPGSGLSLLLDSGVTDANTIMLVNTSFAKRFDNPNASWDIGGWTDVETGISFTYTKQIVDNLATHIKTYSINKPYTGKYSTISADRYVSYFPDVDTTDWELRELLYNSGGNAWIADINGNLQRRSQRTLLRNSETSDLLQESNMRTLSQLTFLLQNKIDSYLLEYNDDSVLKTLSDEVNNMFSNWVGNLVDALEITFERDTNIDGGEILVCYCNVTFRGLILRVPIIVNINRREA